MQFNEAVVAAADHLQTEAKKLWECSTINGAWLNELHAQSEYDHLLCVAKALRDGVVESRMMNGMTQSETAATASVRGLMTETHLINDAYKRIRAERRFANDDLEYDLFAAGWKACASLANKEPA